MEYYSISNFARKIGKSRQYIYWLLKYRADEFKDLRSCKWSKKSLKFKVIGGRTYIPASELSKFQL